MPGYILHLTAAKMFWDRAKDKNLYNENDFYVGNLLPDATSDKKVSHFRNPEYEGNMIEYPDLELFLKKYKNQLDDPCVYGYYFHLYVDNKFFSEYFPSRFTLLNDKLEQVTKREETTKVRIERTGELIPREQFFSEEYYYGDFTKMNNYLIDRFGIHFDFQIPVEDRRIEEVDYDELKRVLRELNVFTDTPIEAVHDLKVFELEDLLNFVKRIVEEW
jgi:hypothetical protein